MSDLATHPNTSVRILPITFEPSTGWGDKQSGAIPADRVGTWDGGSGRLAQTKL